MDSKWNVTWNEDASGTSANVSIFFNVWDTYHNNSRLVFSPACFFECTVSYCHAALIAPLASSDSTHSGMAPQPSYRYPDNAHDNVQSFQLRGLILEVPHPILLGIPIRCGGRMHAPLPYICD